MDAAETVMQYTTNYAQDDGAENTEMVLARVRVSILNDNNVVVAQQMYETGWTFEVP